MDYKIGDIVLYGGDGICRIVGSVERNIGGEVVVYYNLKPIYDEKSTIFVPLGNERLIGKMHGVPTRDEAHNAIDTACRCEPFWIDEDKERAAAFRLSVDGGDIESLVRMLRGIYIQRENRIKGGRKLHVADERALKEIERVLFDELAFVFEIERDEAKELLIGKFTD